MEKIKSISLYIFLGLLAYMPLHIFISTWIGSSFGVLAFAKIAKDVVLLIGFTLVLLSAYYIGKLNAVIQDKLVWAIAAYGVLTVLLAIIKPTDQDAEILGLVYNLRFLLFFVYGLILARLYDSNNLWQRAIRVVLGVSVIVMVFGIIQYTILPDTALTHVGYSRANGVLPVFFIDDKPDLERVMSTMRDPNSFGSYLVIILSFALAYLLAYKNKYLRQVTVGILALGILSLWFSFSRSAWIGALLAAIIVGAVSFKKKKGFRVNKKLLTIGAGCVAVMVLAVYPFRNTYLVQNVIFHADESTTLEDPNELRLRFYKESLRAGVETPLGHGPGTAGLASIRNTQEGVVLNENYYLQLLHETGFIGLLLFLVIVLIVALRLYGKAGVHPGATALLAAFAGLAVTNFLVHIWSNEAVAYTFWGLAGLSLYQPQAPRLLFRRAHGQHDAPQTPATSI
ncbi:O-antigen ligase family protein [Candidatus Saccharibacteria bacterium]|nr:O-antigen ligase family protein [Candidatus Saccharibacteria bacterium]